MYDCEDSFVGIHTEQWMHVLEISSMFILLKIHRQIWNSETCDSETDWVDIQPETFQEFLHA